jgi:hypothetical protein
VELHCFDKIVKEAEEFLGVGNKMDSMFSKDVLRVEVTGPGQPHLTMVDLPGLYHAPDKDQGSEGIEVVESMVLSYIRNPRSVVLAVVTAKNDIGLQKVMKFTRKVDPNGTRTLGIITKPDRLERGSEMEASFYQLASNERLPSRLDGMFSRIEHMTNATAHLRNVADQKPISSLRVPGPPWLGQL